MNSFQRSEPLRYTDFFPWHRGEDFEFGRRVIVDDLWPARAGWNTLMMNAAADQQYFSLTFPWYTVLVVRESPA